MLSFAHFCWNISDLSNFADKNHHLTDSRRIFLKLLTCTDKYHFLDGSIWHNLSFYWNRPTFGFLACADRNPDLFALYVPFAMISSLLICADQSHLLADTFLTRWLFLTDVSSLDDSCWQTLPPCWLGLTVINSAWLIDVTVFISGTHLINWDLHKNTFCLTDESHDTVSA